MIIAARRGGDTSTLLVRRSACPFRMFFSFDLFTLFIYTTRAAYATLAMYIGRSLRGGSPKITVLPPAHSLRQFYTRPSQPCPSATSLNQAIPRPAYQVSSRQNLPRLNALSRRHPYHCLNSQVLLQCGPLKDNDKQPPYWRYI